MRILHVGSGLDPVSGGPAAVLMGLARAQARVGLDVSVVATWVAAPGEAAVRQLEAAGVGVRSIRASNPMSRSPQIRPVVGEMVRRADVVHIHALWEEIQHQAARTCQRLGVPYVIRPCGMLDPWSFAQSRWRKRLYMAWRMRRNLNRAAALHFTSDTERDVTRFHHLQPPAIVEPNGVDLEEYVHLPPRGSFRQKHPGLGERPLIVFLGRIHSGKGVEHLLPALARMETRQAALAVVGPDSRGFGRQMEELAARLGVRERVVFTGLLTGPDKVAALADADVFALPSDHENFGIAVVEALAAGVAVIISDQVYIHREITAARVGAAVPIDVAALAAELDRWLGDDALRRAAAARARPFVWEHYSWDKIAARWVGHYQRLAGAAPGGAQG